MRVDAVSKHKRNTVDLCWDTSSWICVCWEEAGDEAASCCFQYEKHKHHMLPEQTGLCWFCGWVRSLPVFWGISAADGHLKTVISGQGIIPKHTVTVCRTVSALGVKTGPEYFFPSSSQMSERCFRDSGCKLIDFILVTAASLQFQEQVSPVQRTPEC